MKTILRASTVLLLAVALAAPAFAEGEGRGGKGKGKKKGHKIARLFAKFDKDQSGSLTSAEVPERLWNRISKADANGDGEVTKAELREARKGRKGRKGGKGKRGGSGGGSDA